MDLLLGLVDQFGYAAMFLFSWMVFFGLPVPNELAAALAGYLSEWRHFDTYTSFFFLYSGLMSYGIFAFVNGRFFGTKLVSRFMKGKKSTSLIGSGEAWINRYGAVAISFSYFIPGVRLFIPYIAGASKAISLWKYLLYALPSAFIWALIYFQIGRFFPGSFHRMLSDFNLKAAALSAVFLLSTAIVLTVRKKRFVPWWKKVRARK
ncbi:DedA family protein [Bacillus sp. KH172YL63]|uniref:DedA family protein n=1 Tax=Bacillus sp. KH172YL63 TaxID=2709784 RepID=UPI0013E4260F|nr:VTT domain-containing protein [Bacillus sp. KH172YL63]BCB04286.1 putative membrane protein YbfM [Bacillus sp. KH172YL63]